MLFLLCSQSRPSFVSVVFDFNASLNDDAPPPPMSVSVTIRAIKMSELFDGHDLCDYLLCLRYI